jgi:hypothetical protein
MLSEIALSTALTLGATTTAQTEMPFTMYFASVPEAVTQDVVDNSTYDPRQQLTTIGGNVLVADSTSYSTQTSWSTDGTWRKNGDSDTDSQQDD